jgi:trans-aconitate methyltransferase
MEINTQIDAYKKERGPKEHELEMLELIKETAPEFSGHLLDIACASGNFLKLLRTEFPKANLTGFDLSEELLGLAREKLKSDTSLELDIADALSYVPKRKFDVIIASGIMSVFEDFTVPLEKWLSWLDEKGSLFIFGCFNSRDIDVIMKFRNNAIGKNWEHGLTRYSILTVEKYLKEKGYACTFKPFDLKIDIDEGSDPTHSYTVMTSNGKKIILTGANVVTELYFLIIKKIN